MPPAELDLSAEPWLASALLSAEAVPRVDVVVDLTAVSFVDLRCTRLIALSARRLEGSGRRMTLRSPPASVRLVASAAGLSEDLLRQLVS